MKIEAGLHAVGDPRLLQIALNNLLDNAFKYSAKAEKPAVEFLRHSDAETEATFVVRDNGVGFDMQYVGKLFAPFQRLHRAEDFSGTGIGLAIVQRIIARHGGSVRAEGRIGEGAAFYFTLPKERN